MRQDGVPVARIISLPAAGFPAVRRHNVVHLMRASAGVQTAGTMC